MNISGNLQEFLDSLGIKKNKLAESLNVSTSAVSHMLSGKSKLSGPVIELLKLKYNLNPDWLLHGEGEMFLPAKIGGMVEDHPSEAREAGTRAEHPVQSSACPSVLPTTVGEQKSGASTLENPADEPIPGQDKRLQDCVTKWVYLSEPHKATLHELFGFYYERDRKNFEAGVS